MKLHKILKVDGEQRDIVSDTFSLELGTAGRAIAVVIADAPLSGEVTLSLGYGSSLERYFTGYVAASVPVDRRQQRLSIVESSAVLGRRHTISRRNISAAEVIAELMLKTGLGITTGGRRERIKCETETFDPGKSTIVPRLPVFSPGMRLGITPDRGATLQRDITALDPDTGELFFSRRLPATLEINPEHPARLVAEIITGVPLWLGKSVGHLVNIGTGYELLDKFGRIYGIADYCWISQPDGSVYVGEYEHAAVSRKVFLLRGDLFTGLSGVGGDCSVIPTLRPGQRIRIGESDILTITQVTVSGNFMRINFK